MGMSSASSVSLTSLSAVQVTLVRQIITWPLDTREVKPMKGIDYYLDAKVIFIGILVRIFGQSIPVAIAISPTHLRLTLSP